MAATYGELKAEVAVALNRADLTSLIPSLINAAVARANRDVSADGGLLDQEQMAFASLVVDQDTLPVPDDYQSLRFIKIGTDTLEMAPTYDSLIDEYGDATGTPEKYAIFGTAFVFRPVPTVADTVRIGYIKKYQPFASDGDSNWLLTDGGNLLMYAACLEATPQLRDDPRIGTWNGGYRGTLQTLIDADRRARRGPKPAMATTDPVLAAIGWRGGFNITTGE